MSNQRINTKNRVHLHHQLRLFSGLVYLPYPPLPLHPLHCVCMFSRLAGFLWPIFRFCFDLIVPFLLPAFQQANRFAIAFFGHNTRAADWSKHTHTHIHTVFKTFAIWYNASVLFVHCPTLFSFLLCGSSCGRLTSKSNNRTAIFFTSLEIESTN